MWSIKKITISGEPLIHVRTVLPSDSEELKKEKLKKPFLTCGLSILTVFTEEKQFTITAKKGYCFDGATIPFGLGKGDTVLHIPALFHDIICENKALVDYNRRLSSDIFYNLLLMHKCNKLKAKIMYYAVDTYQRFMRGWK